MASGNLLYDTRSSAWPSVTTYRSGMGWEGSSRGRGHKYTYDWCMLMYGRNQYNIVIILQLKINKLKKEEWVLWRYTLRFKSKILISSSRMLEILICFWLSFLILKRTIIIVLKKLCHLQRQGWTQRLSYRMKSEREKQILYINASMWNLEKMVQMNLFAK